MLTDFCFEITDKFNVPGAGVVIYGDVHFGTIKLGDKVRIFQEGNDIVSTITGIALHRKKVNSVSRGDSAGLLLDKNVSIEQINLSRTAYASNRIMLGSAYIDVQQVFDHNGQAMGYGKVLRGKIKIGDVMSVAQLPGLMCEIQDIDNNHKKEACAGESVGLLLKGLRKEDIIPYARLTNYVYKDHMEFCFSVKDIHVYKGNGELSGKIEAIGTIETGMATKGMRVSYLAGGILQKTTIWMIEKGGHLYNSAKTGDEVGLILRTNDSANIHRGSFLFNSNLMDAWQSSDEAEDTPSESQQIVTPVSSVKPSVTKSALLIGNCSYQGMGDLRNCINDVVSIGKSLKKLGFDVTVVTNSNKEQMDKAIMRYEMETRGNDVSLFYYSGHGLQCKGQNYLIPADALLASESDIKYRCVSADYILDKLNDSGSKLKIVILDACRTSPFSGRGKGKSVTSIGGLASMESPEGTIIAYATSPNSIASDGAGNNSPYAEAFVNTLKISGLSVLEFLNTVASTVMLSTNKEQIPWMSASPISGQFYFNEPYTPTPQQSGINQTHSSSQQSGKAFSLFLKDSGLAKLQVVKLVHDILGIGLWDAKNLVDRCPCMLMENLTGERAAKLKTRLEEAGAKVSII